MKYPDQNPLRALSAWSAGAINIGGTDPAQVSEPVNLQRTREAKRCRTALPSDAENGLHRLVRRASQRGCGVGRRSTEARRPRSGRRFPTLWAALIGGLHGPRFRHPGRSQTSRIIPHTQPTRKRSAPVTRSPAWFSIARHSRPAWALLTGEAAVSAHGSDRPRWSPALLPSLQPQMEASPARSSSIEKHLTLGTRHRSRLGRPRGRTHNRSATVLRRPSRLAAGRECRSRGSGHRGAPGQRAAQEGDEQPLFQGVGPGEVLARRDRRGALRQRLAWG